MANITTPCFHLFPRLPLELRQQIWELSIAPREVVIVGPNSNFGHGRRASPPPPLLLTSTESRSYCQQFYTKAYLLNGSTSPIETLGYSWVNFDIDEVYMTAADFMFFSAIPIVQRLTLVSHIGEYFFHRVENILPRAKALKALTIIDREGAPADRWYGGWSDFMEERYYRCDPEPCYTKIVHDDLVLTPDNMLKFDREYHKTQWLPELEENPDEYGSDVAISDDDADPRDSRRRTWHHTKDCTCPQKSRQGYRYL
ncbi:hypothetical protein NEMBOFW57_010807 [Staphylotrichum longicolle]|uniref:2EXR domain-containing protein n=1 Tax=Staphylotrichum longicolle TaxID=669026 RepID=A0AAD4HT73_9PEZI|nr:hypothetical protein NEMBOFW57_010807 [Staphylotrichum longicolle]